MPRPAGRVARDFRQQCWIMTPGQTLMRTAAVRELGGFDTSIWGSDDWDLYIRLAAHGTFLYEDRVALHYRQHAGNASARALEHVRNHLKVVRRHIGWNVPLLISHQHARRATSGRSCGTSRTAAAPRCATATPRRHNCSRHVPPYAGVRKQWLVPFLRVCLRRPLRHPTGNSGERP